MTDIFGGNGRYIYEDFDFNQHKGINCLVPTEDSDVANKHYVDSRTAEQDWDTDGNVLEVAGTLGTINDISFSIIRNSISRMEILSTSTVLHSNLSMSGHNIVSCLDPVNDSDVATKHYVDTSEIGPFVLKTGDTMTGDLTFNAGGTKTVNVVCNGGDKGFKVGISDDNKITFDNLVLNACTIRAALIRFHLTTSVTPDFTISDSGFVLGNDITFLSPTVNRYIKHYGLQSGKTFTVGAGDTSIFRAFAMFENVSNVFSVNLEADEQHFKIAGNDVVQLQSSTSTFYNNVLMNRDLSFDGNGRAGNVQILASNIGTNTFLIGLNSTSCFTSFFIRDEVTYCAVAANEFRYASNNIIIISSNVARTVIYNELNMNNNLIFNVKDPVDAQDAATKNYVDVNTWALNGNNIVSTNKIGSKNDMNVVIVRNNVNKISCNNASVQIYSNLYIRKTSDNDVVEDVDASNIYMGSTTLAVGDTFIIPLGNSTNKIYFTNTDNSSLYIKGYTAVKIGVGNVDTMSVYQINMVISKPLSMSNNNIVNVADPVNAQDVATKNYVDTNGNYVLKAGDTMTGNLTY